MTASIAKKPAALRCVLGLAVVFAPMVVAAMERPVSRHPTSLPIVKLLARIAPAPAKSEPVMELVWKGADIDGDQIPDLAVGRLTADSREELAAMIKKIIAYEASTDFGPWRRRVNFIAGVGGFGPVTDGILDMATKKFIGGGIELM